MEVGTVSPIIFNSHHCISEDICFDFCTETKMSVGVGVIFILTALDSLNHQTLTRTAIVSSVLNVQYPELLYL